MSIHPFSYNEIESLKELLKQLNWNMNGTIDNYFRFSIKKNKILVLTLKFPVVLPERLNIPFEIGCFRLSVAFQFWNLTENFTNFITYLVKLMNNLASQVAIEHQFPIDEKRNQFLEILNAVIPDVIKDENERAWLNRIRISLMNKRDQFKGFDSQLLPELTKVLNGAGLTASFKQPWELKKGLPKLRTSETLFYSNEEPFDEFFIIEKGFYTYYKDLEYNKFFLRTFFETYTPYVLYGLFGNNPDFKYESYIESWIKFARLMLNSILEILNKIEISASDFIQFNSVRELGSEDFEDEQNNFPLSALHYESLIAKELYPIHTDLFNKPPEDFEVIEHMDDYTEAENLINNYRFNDATAILNESLKVFNKYKQKKVVVSILLLLRKIASLLNQTPIAINYLQSALGVAKSGEVPIKYILKIHYKLGKSYYNTNELEKSFHHFKILLNFLENENTPINDGDYLGMVHLYLGLIEAERSNTSESRNHFKTSLHIGEKSQRIKLYYHLLRTIQLKNKGNISQAFKILKTGLESPIIQEMDEKNVNILIDMYLEAIEFFIHQRKDSRRAVEFLRISGDYLSIKTIPGIQRSIRWNLLMSDFYNFLAKNREKNIMFMKKAQNLKGRLREIGVLE